jgi:hypothetical protein
MMDATTWLSERRVHEIEPSGGTARPSLSRLRVCETVETLAARGTTPAIAKNGQHSRARAGWSPTSAMPPKKGGKKGGKKKGPAYMTHEDGVDHCAPFGFAPGDMIHTPLGLRACVLGVKYASPEDLGGGVLWVKYDGPLEKEAPIENPSVMSGYVRAPETAHLWREVDRLNAAAAVKAEKRRIANARKNAEAALEAAKTASSAPKKPAAAKKKEEDDASGDNKENA